MGTWGPGLYQDDITCDIKEEYRNWLRLTQSNKIATHEVLNNNLCGDSEEDNLIWLALADTQWSYGRLTDEVKVEALKCLENGVDLERWNENKNQYNKRKKILENLKEKLNSPQPPQKKVPKLVIDKALWEKGDVLLYKLCDKKLEGTDWYNKYILLKVVGINKTNIGSLPKEYMDEQNILIILNWIGSHEPTTEILSRIQAVYDYTGQLNDGNIWYCIISNNQKREKKKKLKVITKEPVSKEEIIDIKKARIWLNINNMDIAYVNALEEYEKNGGIIIRQ